MFEFLISVVDVWTPLKIMPELILGLSLKTFVEEGEVSWAALKRSAWVPDFLVKPTDLGIEVAPVAPAPQRADKVA